MELIQKEQMDQWMECIDEIAKKHSFEVERKSNHIDVILGHPRRSVTRYEFFRFQKAFEMLNQELGFHMSGVLWLMPADHSIDTLPDMPWEFYVLGRLVHGDSIGRPHRHRLNHKK